MRQRYAQDVVAGGFNRADTDEDESKCSNKFREPGTKFFHGIMRSNRAPPDNMVLEPKRSPTHQRSSDISREAAARLYPPPQFFPRADKRSPLYLMREA